MVAITVLKGKTNNDGAPTGSGEGCGSTRGASADAFTPSLGLRLQQEPLSAKMTNNSGLDIGQPNLTTHSVVQRAVDRGRIPQALL